MKNPRVSSQGRGRADAGARSSVSTMHTGGKESFTSTATTRSGAEGSSKGHGSEWKSRHLDAPWAPLHVPLMWVCRWLVDLASIRIITWPEPMLAAEARASAADLVKTVYADAELPEDL
jgi:hypothetical protein